MKLLACVALVCWLPLLARAQAGSYAVPLQCRLETAAWRSCRMVVEQLGRHWYLELDNQRIEFRHDGDGRIRMRTRTRRDARAWRQVDTYWDAEGNLCWGQVCAKGDIPLD